MVRTRPPSRRRSSPLVPGVPSLVALLALTALQPGTGRAQQTIPPDTVSTLGTSEPLRGFGNLGGVAVDALGFVYVANFREAVWRIAPDGTAKKLTDALYGASGNAVDRRGDLYQSNFNGHTITRIRRTGEVETFVSGGLNGPVGLAFDPDGDLYVCNCTGGSISRVTPDGAVSEFARSPLMACPNGITVDDRGDLYVVNFNNPLVLRITPDGEVHEFTTVAGAGGNGHIAFARGGFYVTQFRGHSLFRVDRDGQVTRVAGDGVQEVRDGSPEEARFSYPNGIAVAPNGNVIWINDLVGGPLGAGLPTEMALRRVRIVTLIDVLDSRLDPALPGAHATAVGDIYRAYREARAGESILRDAVTAGYRLLSTARAGAALALFLATAADHPASPTAQYHLGEAYRFTGQPEDAARQYRRTLELDPDFPQAAERLALVTGAGGPR